eukprot:2549088-Prymnesium_polylepis.2
MHSQRESNVTVAADCSSRQTLCDRMMSRSSMSMLRTYARSSSCSMWVGLMRRLGAGESGSDRTKAICDFCRTHSHGRVLGTYLILP